MEVLINNQQKLLRLNRRRFVRIAQEILVFAGRAATEPIELSLVFCDDDFIQKLNREYRGIDKPTDVLSFPMGDDAFSPEIEVLGDVIVSVETAQRQATQLDHPLELELIFLLIHGILHLLGHTHDDRKTRTEMRRQEESICSHLADRRLLARPRHEATTVIGRVDHRQ